MNLMHAYSRSEKCFRATVSFLAFLLSLYPLIGQSNLRLQLQSPDQPTSIDQQVSFGEFQDKLPVQENQRIPFFDNSPSFDKKRANWVTGFALGGYVSMMTYMGTVWYAQEDLGRFHFFNDLNEWQQMDKVGHALGAYHESRLLIDLYKWAGMSKNKAMLIGGLGGFLSQTSIEVFDGFAKKWGASWYDVAANGIGSSLAVANKMLWDEDRIQLKFSYRRSPYVSDPSLERLFGTTYPEWILKDYNGQTYWLSFRVHSFLPDGEFKRIYPKWLNIAIGYGAEGLQGGYGQVSPAEIKAREYRQMYLAFDIDLNNIDVRQKWLKTVLNILSFVHIPSPALQFDKRGIKLRGYL